MAELAGEAPGAYLRCSARLRSVDLSGEARIRLRGTLIPSV